MFIFWLGIVFSSGAMLIALTASFFSKKKIVVETEIVPVEEVKPLSQYRPGRILDLYV